MDQIAASADTAGAAVTDLGAKGVAAGDEVAAGSDVAKTGLDETKGAAEDAGSGIGGMVKAFALVEVAMKGFEYLKGAIEGATQQQQSVVLLTNAMEKNAGASKEQVKQTTDWIMAQARATGISHEQLMPAYMQLVDATHSVSKAQELLTLGMNISAERGIPLISITKALMRAAEGSAAGLARYGIATKSAVDPQILL
jgi:hypothetical protein